MKNKFKQELRLLYSTNAQSQDGTRLTSLDMARGIVILLVVIGHSGFAGPACNIWLSTFHLPTFFLLSGILIGLKKEESRSLPHLIPQKAKSILVPYLWFSIGSVMLDILQVFLGNFTWDVVLEHTVQTITLRGYSVLWFLPVLFFAELILLLILKLCARLLPGKTQHTVLTSVLMTCIALIGYYGYQRLLDAALPSLALNTLLTFAKTLIAAAFISYGCLFALLGSGKSLSFPRWKALLSGALLSGVNLILIPYVQLMDLNHLQLHNPWIYLALGTTGSLGCLLLCMSLPNIPPLTFYGQNSLIIMCTHMNFYIMYLSMLFNLYLVPRLPGGGDTMYAAFSLIGTMLLSIPVILIVRMFLPFMLGRRKGHAREDVQKKAA